MTATMHAGTQPTRPAACMRRVPQAPAAARALCEHGMCLSRPSGGGRAARGVDQHPELHPELHPGMHFPQAPAPDVTNEATGKDDPAEAAAVQPSATKATSAKVKPTKPPDLGAWAEIKALLSTPPPPPGPLRSYLLRDWGVRTCCI